MIPFFIYGIYIYFGTEVVQELREHHQETALTVSRHALHILFVFASPYE